MVDKGDSFAESVSTFLLELRELGQHEVWMGVHWFQALLPSVVHRFHTQKPLYCVNASV